jgi:hypothetical protein
MVVVHNWSSGPERARRNRDDATVLSTAASHGDSPVSLDGLRYKKRAFAVASELVPRNFLSGKRHRGGTETTNACPENAEFEHGTLHRLKQEYSTIRDTICEQQSSSFPVFVTQRSSFLIFERVMEQTRRSNYARLVLEVQNTPTDSQFIKISGVAALISILSKYIWLH